MVLALVLAAVAYVRSDAGSALIRQKVMEATSNQFKGRLEVGGLSVGAGTVELSGLKLFTPEGELVAEVDSVHAEVSLLALARSKVIISQARLTGVRLWLVQDERGLNLTRALEAKVASAPEPGPNAPSAFEVQVKSLQLEGGLVDFRVGEQHYAASTLAITANAGVKGPALRLDGALKLTGQLTAPLQAPLTLEADSTTMAPDDLRSKLSVSVGGATLEASLRWPTLEATVAALRLPPEVLRAFAPGSGVKPTLEAKGFVSLERADLALQAGAATATVKAQYRLEGPSVEAFELNVADVDLAQLLEGGRPSRLTFKATGRLSDSALGSLDGAVRVVGDWKSPEGAELARLDVDASATRGVVQVKQLEAAVPGAALSATGQGTSEAMRLRGKLVAADLSKVAQTVAAFTGKSPPALSGSGELEVALNGPLAHPGVTAKGHFDTLALDEVRLSGLVVDASVPDIARPLESDGTLFVKRLQAGARTFDDVTAKVVTEGRQLAVELSTKGLADVVVRAEGVFDKRGQGLALNLLEVEYPEAQWRLGEPTRLDFPPSAFRLQPLTLRSGSQVITVAASQTGTTLAATLDVSALELGRLPHVLVPPSAQLEGQLDAKLTALGRLPRPAVEGRLELKHGRALDVRKVEATLEAKYGKDHLAARLSAHSDVGQVQASFDGPLEGLLDKKDEPLAATVEVLGADLEHLALGLRAEWPAEGQLAGKLSVTGTAAAPVARAHLELADGVLELSKQPARSLPVPRLTLDVEPRNEAGAFSARLAGLVLGATVQAELQTALTLVGLRDQPPTLAQLKALPVQLVATLDGVDLAAVREAHLIDAESLSGRVSLSFEARGSVTAPDVSAQLGFAQVKLAPVLPLDGALTLVTNREDTRVSLKLTRPGLAVPVLAFEGRAQAAVERFAHPEALSDIALTLEGTVGPLTAREVLDPGLEGVPPQGQVKAFLSASGTPADPRVKLRGTLDGLAIGKVPLGKAGFALDYQDAVSAVSVSLGSTGGGVLKARGSVGLNLSQPAVLAGLDWKKAPVNLTVEAQRFDLAFLSGAVPTVRTLGGQLSANASVTATLGAPQAQGSLSWTEGRLGVLGYGEYRDVVVLLEGGNQRISLKKLAARNSGGTLQFEGEAVRTARGFYELRASGRTEKFPLITDDQLRAIVTLNADLVGELNDELLDLRPLRISKAVIELPDVKSKDLQDLERPRGIVLLRDGLPLSAAERKKLRAQAAAARGEAAQKSRTIRVLIEAPANLWVKSSDLNVELGLSEGFRVEVAETTQVSGEVLLRGGRIDVIGRRFDVQKNSSVRFSGLATMPYLNVTATHVNEREGVTVYATLVGRGKDFSLKTSSSPPLSDSEIFTLLATGRRSLKRGGSATITAGSAVSVVGSLAATQLKSALGKKLPIDVLSVEAGDEGLQGTRIEAGKYITDQLYLGYQVQYGADPNKGENTNAGKLEYQFTPRWGLEAYGGDSGAFGADVMWSREY